MSWFSKISSWNIRFNEEIEKDIDEVSQVVTDYFLNNKKIEDIYTNWEISSPYSKNKTKIELRILPTVNNQVSFAEYNLLLKVMYIYPYNLKTKIRDRKRIFDAFRILILHEVVHSIDPKMYIPKIFSKSHPTEKDQNYSDEFYYYSSPTEFDAYSKQITEDIKQKSLLFPNIRNEIMRWLKYSTIYSQDFLSSYKDILDLWTQSDREKGTDYIKRFKIRLYNEYVLGENPNAKENNIPYKNR